jgi:hypothetical protein
VDELNNGEAAEVPEGQQIAESLIDIHKLCSATIAEANRVYANNYDSHRQAAPTYQVGDKVFLSMANINTVRPMKKLDVRQSGPFAITEVVSSHAYRLKLLATARIHNVFHTALLRPYTASSFPGQVEERPMPIEVDGDMEYEVARILDSRLRRGKLEYLLEWLGYEGDAEQTSWEPRANVRGAKEAVESFHLANPDKPSPNIGETGSGQVTKA